MKKWLPLLAFIMLGVASTKKETINSWIRINQLGYQPSSVKVAVWCSKDEKAINTWQLVDAATKKIVATGRAGKAFGGYGPFTQTYRLDFSSYKKAGRYYLQAGKAISPEFKIDDDVYKGAADFCLRYMRQQRSGYNPFLKDSCHTNDGYTLYTEKTGVPDSTHIDVVGGWHDASDYLQYVTTSANATYHLLMAYRDFPQAFTDEKLANGLAGKNDLPDVLDEAKWGIDWLLKMFPQQDMMFNQLGDDRDHMGMRIPGLDSFYGRGFERPVYFVSGEPQQRGKFMNNTTGTSSTAAKYASVFALAHHLYERDSLFRRHDERKGYDEKAFEAWQYALKKPGVTQTASVRSPYIYAEENWVDDMELAAAAMYNMLANTSGAVDQDYYRSAALGYAKKENVTPWLGGDTAKHYQWYPFINLGHYELATQLKDKRRDTIINYYRQGIESVWAKAKNNSFYRGVPFIWCSNNLTTSFAIQCYWYRKLSGDNQFEALEQANFDWLFGCNPWGTSMVYGLPSWGDTPVDPHSAFTHLKNYPIDGGLVDGPVYGSIYGNLIGIQLMQPDEYAAFQSQLAVYHDDYGDYSTNEPTMDGTASLIYLLAAREATTNKRAVKKKALTFDRGAITRGDLSNKEIALVFTGHEYADGANYIRNILKQYNAKASFFFTGRFYETPGFAATIKSLAKDGHYLGPHSYNHLLYCDWNKRDSLLVDKKIFTEDYIKNLDAMRSLGIGMKQSQYFMPPYEWYNDTISAWSRELHSVLINFTPGTRSNADYTTPGMKNYRSSDDIYQSIMQYEKQTQNGLNGFILLLHIGTDPARTDKMYYKLPVLLRTLSGKGYRFVTIDKLLE